MSCNETIADIARELNTTPATVSRAFSGRPGISEQTRRNVQQVAGRLNYKRNRVASSLRSGKTHVIGVIIPSAEINFFGSVVHGIESIQLRRVTADRSYSRTAASAGVRRAPAGLQRSADRCRDGYTICCSR